MKKHFCRLVNQIALVLVLSVFITTPTAHAQSGHPQQVTPQASGDQTLPAQLTELRAKVAKIEAALRESPQGKATRSAGAGAGGMQMGAGGRQSGMGMMEHEPMGMSRAGGGMSSTSSRPEAGGSPCMGMMGGGAMGMTRSRGGMEMMGSMESATGMPMPSTLPGFPGASHLYHVGSTGFFLDHPEHITLTMEQQTTLGRIKEKALLDQATTQRKIEGAEQELWTLTGADQPAADKVDAKVKEIEKLRADQRMTFIRAVGEAAQVLTDEQRQALLGQIPPATSKMPQTAPSMGGGMKDM